MACSAGALALSVSLAALAGEASGFDCGNCASQIFTESVAEFGDLVAEDCPPAAFGRMVPDSCPPTCSAMFVPWWASCGRPGELPELDQVPGLRDALAGFDGLCGGSGDGGTGGHH